MSNALYRGALRVVRGTFPLFAKGEGKLARGIRGREGVLSRMRSWAETGRERERPLVWLHAASVGEGLQAFAVMEALRSRRPEVQLVYTFFSPSAERLAARSPADFSDYLPLDVTDEVRGALDAIAPTVIVFSKHDVWSTLVSEAKERGVRVALLSATLPASSSRLGFVARKLLGGSYAELDAVAAISADDAARFERLGVPLERRSVMGDAHFDRVHARAAAATPDAGTSGLLHDPGRITLVAGSTWEADERHLLDAWAPLAGSWNRLLLVPHEPTPSHLAQSEKLIAGHGLSAIRLSAIEHGGAVGDVVLVDRMGVLGDLYAVADLAYVGGGWGSAGIHSVLEPAAFGIPVVFGPRHLNAREAAELVQDGAALEAQHPADLLSIIRSLVSEDETRRRAGEAARRYVEDRIGAAARGADVIEVLLDAR